MNAVILNINTAIILTAVVMIGPFQQSAGAQATTAYEIAAGTAGGQAYGGSLGMDFIVIGGLTVVDLGAFDSGSDGLFLPITVELWSRDDGGTPDVPADDVGIEVLATLEFTQAAPGTLVGGSRFKSLASPLPLLEGAYTIVAYGYGDAELNLNLGGQPGGPSGLTTADSPAIAFVGGGRFGDAGAFPANPDGGPENRYGAGTFTFTTEDTDSDGMPDVWEEEFGLDINSPDDAAEDTLDMDGLTNLEEFQNGTDPTEADTDGDNLSDGDEVNVTETDPTNPDSDNDVLTDDVETNTGVFESESDTGTDPNNPDTDSDGFGDGREVTAGSDPNDADDVPANLGFDGVLAIDYLEGAPGTQTFGEGLGHDFIVSEEIRVTALGVFDSNADGLNLTLGAELWQRDEAGTPDSFGDDTGTLLVSMTFTSLDPGTLVNSNRVKNLDDPIFLEPGTYSVVGRGYGNGELNGNEGTGGPFAEHKLVNEGDGLLTFVGVSRFGGGGVGTDGFPNSADGGPEVRYSAGTFVYDTGAPIMFQITEVDVDQGAGEVTIIWNSRDRSFYSVDFSDDLILWQELDDSVASGGEATSYTEFGVPPGARRRYYRIREDP